MSFEKKIDRLEQIVKKMEDGEITLDDSLRFFEEGVKLARECQGQLQEAEQKVKLLLELDAEGNPTLTDFKVNLNEKSE